MRLRVLLVLLVAALVAACDQQAALEGLLPKEEDAYARTVFTRLCQRDLAAIEAAVNPGVGEPDAIRAALQQAANLLPPEAPSSLRPMGVQVNVANGRRSVALTYELTFAKRWAVGLIVLRPDGARYVIDTLRVMPTADSQERLNAFDAPGKGLLHYAMLALVVVTPLFMLATFVMVLRTPGLPARWVWAVAALIGTGRITFDWTTGQWAIQALHFGLLGGGYMKPPMGPLTLIWSAPLPALAFCWQRYRTRRRAVPDAPRPAPDSPPPDPAAIPALLESLEAVLIRTGETRFAAHVAAARATPDTIRALLVSNELWRGSGSIADQAGVNRGGEARRAIEAVLIDLGRAQQTMGLVNSRTGMWVGAFSEWRRSRR
jgi:hypothetical protein